MILLWQSGEQYGLFYKIIDVSLDGKDKLLVRTIIYHHKVLAYLMTIGNAIPVVSDAMLYPYQYLAHREQ